MSDVRTQLLRREAWDNPEDVDQLWSYIRALEQSQDIDVGGGDYFVPYLLSRWGYESAYSISFVCLPLVKHYTSLKEMRDHLEENSWGEEWKYNSSNLYEGILRDNVSGYAIIDKAVYELVENVNCTPGGDSASDAMVRFKTALCVALAHTDIYWAE